MQPPARFHVAYAVLAFCSVVLLHDAWEAARAIAPIPYSQFQQLVREGKVEEVTVADREIRGRLLEPVEGRAWFVTTSVEGEVAALLDEHGVRYQGQVESRFLATLASWVVPTLLFLAGWAYLAQRLYGGGGSGGGLMSIGKSKAKVYMESDTGVSFGDVAGVDEAKAELEEIVAYLKDPDGRARLGAKMPKGVLLVGPPGTGKTLLARAVAGEASVAFFSISGSEFVEMFVGVGAARVRDLFEQARAKSPCIIFIDELDALGMARNSSASYGGHDEKEQTLNQLLVELDGFDPGSGIVLLAATNRPEILDPALLRAGRFDRQVLVDRPDKAGRAAILDVHLKSVTLAEDVDAGRIAELTPGFSGAELANLTNEAALGATRRDAIAVAMADFEAAIERLVAGAERRNRILGARERSIVAHHEMGHALVAAAVDGADPVHKVSIIPRGIGALGYTLQRPSEDRYLLTREELLARIKVLLGGRAAEHLIFGHWSTGAADDLARATDIARDMVTRYAMDPALGPVSYDNEPSSLLGPVPAGYSLRPYGEATAERIDRSVRQLLEAAWRETVALLATNRVLLEEAAADLLARETLSQAELAPLFARIRAARTAGVEEAA